LSTIFALNFDNPNDWAGLRASQDATQALCYFTTSLIKVWEGRLLVTPFVNKMEDLHGAGLLAVASNYRPLVALFIKK
jgi:hypothetical protein